MCIPLLKRNIKQTVVPMVIVFSVLAMYFGVIIYMYDPEMMALLDSYKEMMPEMMSAFGMNGMTDSMLKFMNTYLYGFLMMLFPFIFTVVLGNLFVMKYEDTGSLASLLASPNTRTRIILTQAVSLIAAVTLLLVLVTGMGIGFSEVMFPGELEIGTFWALNGCLLLTHLSISGIAFAAACFVQNSKLYYVIGCGLPLVSYLFTMLGNMGDSFEWMKYCSIFSLFPADRIINHESVVGYIIALVVIILALYISGIVKFIKKDIFL